MVVYFKNLVGVKGMLLIVQDMVNYYCECNIVVVIFFVDVECEIGFCWYFNEEVVLICVENDDILILFVLVDLYKGKVGVCEVCCLVCEFGVKGFKFYLIMQGFFFNDCEVVYIVFEVVVEEGVILLFYIGQIGVGLGMCGGMGMWLKYFNLMYLDDVVVDFLDMLIVLVYLLFLWIEEGLVVVQYKLNVYYDMLGWLFKYFFEMFICYVNLIFKKKMLFGLDWLVIMFDCWLVDFEKVLFKDEVCFLILKENVLCIFGVEVQVVNCL